MLLCPLGCGKKLNTVEEIDNHYKNECVNGLIQCKCCEATMLRSETEKHLCMEVMYNEIISVEQKLDESTKGQKEQREKNEVVRGQN